MNIIPKSFYLDDIFDDFLSTSNSKVKCDIYEKDGDYHIEMDVPGFNKEDINIDIKDGYLNISAERKNETKEEDKNYIRKERVYGAFKRSFYIGDIEVNDIKAKFENGMLKIEIPKQEVIENKKVIEIE